MQHAPSPKKQRSSSVDGTLELSGLGGPGGGGGSGGAFAWGSPPLSVAASPPALQEQGMGRLDFCLGQ